MFLGLLTFLNTFNVIFVGQSNDGGVCTLMSFFIYNNKSSWFVSSVTRNEIKHYNDSKFVITFWHTLSCT